LEAPSVFRF